MPDRCRFTPEAFLWLVAAACRMHRLPFDPALVQQQFPPPHSLASLQAALAGFGFRSATAPFSSARAESLSFPCCAFLAPTAEPPATPAGAPPGDSDPHLQPGAAAAILLLAAKDGQIACLRPTDAQVGTTTATALVAAGVDLVLEFTRAEKGLTEADEQAGRPFGFRWFVPELLKYRRIWRDVLLASLAIQLVGLATPLFTQVIIDKVIVHQTRSTLVVLGVALTLFLAFTAVMSWLRQYLILHTGNRIDAVLGSEVFRHLLRLPLPYFEARPTGTLVARLQGVETIREFVSGAAVTLVLDLPFLLIFLAVMVWYSWQLSLIAVALLAVVCLLSLLVTPLFRQRLNQQFLLGARNQSFLTEYVAGMATVKSLQMEAHVEKRYGEYLAGYLAAGFATRQVTNGYSVAANALEQAMALSILVAGALLVMRNEGFTVGMLVAFQMFAARLSQPMLRLVGLWQEFQQAAIAVQRLGDIVDQPTEPHSLTPAREAGNAGRIELLDLAFRYSDQHPWLYRGLNLVFEPGRLIVLMGSSGCGKSTLAKLLQGFYRPQEGQIRIDGHDIRHLAANELRATFGVVPQETILFAGTLYDNLIMAQPHASFEDVLVACKAAEIHAVIEGLPNAYQSEIGERGVGLSGGQLQRLAIARALLKRPRVLIFDEAVSNLDGPTAEQFARTINHLKGKVTIVFITHQIPRGLLVDDVVTLAAPTDTS